MRKGLLLSASIIALLALVDPAEATLPTSGAISLSAIQGEFGGSNPISMGEYYAGGGLVPGGTTGNVGAVPSSQSNMRFDLFHGTTAFGGSDTTYHYTDSGSTITVPSGANSCRIIGVSGIGSGGFGDTSEPGPVESHGGNGGGGATCDFTTACTGGNTFTITINSASGYGTGGTVGVTGSLSGGTITRSATGGSPGGNASPFSDGSDGAGGSGSGFTSGSSGAGSSGGAGSGNYGGDCAPGTIRVIFAA